MARSGVSANLLLDPLNQRGIQDMAIHQLDEKHHAHVVILAWRPVLADDQGFDDFR